MMTPKIIHYCWFGPKPIPELEQQCIASWKKYLPDYELKFWNESTFDLSSAPLFARQAYEHKKYAFVSDYVRMKVLYEYGGLYLDTDLEILKPLDGILKPGANVMGFENHHHLGTAILWFAPKNDIIKSVLAYYETHPFVDKNNRLDIIANVTILTDVLKTHGMTVNGEHQTVGDIDICKREVFYPKKISSKEFACTEETLTIHRYSCSWLSEKQKARGNNKMWIKFARPTLLFLRSAGVKMIGKENIRSIEVWIRNKMN